MCVSVAWDWVYKGVSQEGCWGEMACALRCANDNRRFGVVSLAPVETCLLQVCVCFFFSTFFLDSPMRSSSFFFISFVFFGCFCYISSGREVVIAAVHRTFHKSQNSFLFSVRKRLVVAPRQNTVDRHSHLLAD